MEQYCKILPFASQVYSFEEWQGMIAKMMMQPLLKRKEAGDIIYIR
jgi:hypothetical protein